MAYPKEFETCLNSQWDNEDEQAAITEFRTAFQIFEKNEGATVAVSVAQKRDSLASCLSLGKICDPLVSLPSSLSIVEPGVWRLSFPRLFAYQVGGKVLRPWEFKPELTPLCKGKIPEWTRSRGVQVANNFNHEKLTLLPKESVTGMLIEIEILLPLFFLIGQHPPSVLDRKSRNLLPQSPNLPFQYFVS